MSTLQCSLLSTEPRYIRCLVAQTVQTIECTGECSQPYVWRHGFLASKPARAERHIFAAKMSASHAPSPTTPCRMQHTAAQPACTSMITPNGIEDRSVERLLVATAALGPRASATKNQSANDAPRQRQRRRSSCSLSPLESLVLRLRAQRKPGIARE